MAFGGAFDHAPSTRPVDQRADEGRYVDFSFLI
jgi:hypothetical protein